MIRNGKLFGKINIFDAVTIIVVLLLAVGAVLKLGVMDNSQAQQEQTIVYHVQIKNIRDYSVNNLRVGDGIYSGTNDMRIGTITDVAASPAKVTTTILDGSYVEADVEGRFDVVLTIETPGTTVDGRNYVDGTYEISANTTRDYYTKYVSFSGTCLDISRR